MIHARRGGARAARRENRLHNYNKLNYIVRSSMQDGQDQKFRTVELAECCSCRPRNWLCSPQTAQTERYMHGRRNYRLAANSSPWFLLSRTTVMGLRGDDGEDCRRHSNTEKLGRITQQYEYAGPRTVELADCCSCRPRNWLCSSQTAQTERSTIMHARPAEL